MLLLFYNFLNIDYDVNAHMYLRCFTSTYDIFKFNIKLLLLILLGI